MPSKLLPKFDSAHKAGDNTCGELLVGLFINHPEADRLLHALVEITGESSEELLIAALRDRLERISRVAGNRRPGELLAIGRECAALPDYDARSADEILGYDKHGIPR